MRWCRASAVDDAVGLAGDQRLALVRFFLGNSPAGQRNETPIACTKCTMLTLLAAASKVL